MRVDHRSKRSKFVFLLLVVWMAGASCPASAIVDVPGDGPDLPNVATLKERSIGEIRRFSRDGMRIIVGSECERLLLEASLRLGRPLTQPEILDNYSEILKATGETLEPENIVVRTGIVPSPIRRSGGCFTGNMTVATPSGSRKIMDLLDGDQVISIDLVSRQPVTNTIHKIHPYAARNYGRLVNLPTPIDVTERHRFLAQGRGIDFDFHAIGDLPEDADLYLVDLTQPAGRQWRPVRRGCYLPQLGTRTVYDIELIGEPRNFMVEGILVHNIKM